MSAAPQENAMTPEEKTPEERNALNQAFAKALNEKDYKAADAALARGANIDSAYIVKEQYGNGSSGTALHNAVEQLDYKEAQWLLKRGANPNVYVSNKTPLLRAVNKTTYKGDDEAKLQERATAYRISRLLLEHGADPNEPKRVEGSHVYPRQYALHIAATVGNEPMVKMLLRHGADVNLRGDDGSSPLWCAATQNRKRTCAVLLNAGAEPTAWQIDKGHSMYGGAYYNKKTALHHLDHSFAPGSPAYLDKMELAKMLLDAGADVFAKDSAGKTPAEFMDAIYQGRGKDMAALYRRYEQYPKFEPENIGTLRRRDLFSVDRNGNVLLDSPSTWRHFEAIVAHLKEIGEPLTLKDLQGKNQDGISWLERGVECFALKEILKEYAAPKEPESLAKLVGAHARRFKTTEENVPPVLRAAATRMQLNALFDPELWKGHTKGELRTVYGALTEEMQSDVDNFQTILSRLPEGISVPRRGLGRLESEEPPHGMSR